MVFERIHTNKIRITNIPVTINFDVIRKLFGGYGRIINIDKDFDEKQNETYDAYITYESPGQAKTAYQKLNLCEIEGYILGVQLCVDESQDSRIPRGSGQNMNHKPYSGNRGSPLHASDFPLRILVLSDMVGAIIGRSGETIRHITQQSRARVDIHRKENSGAFHKHGLDSVQVITIYGNPENCSLACQKILEVMQQEANKTNRGEIDLKILAHDNLIGRIIGRNGNTIKHIMETTDTKVIVSSNFHDLNKSNFERVITVKGELENICKAQQMISSKLKQSYENDLAAMAPSAMMYPGPHHMRPPFSGNYQGYPPNHHLGGVPPPPPPPYGMYGNQQIPPYNAPMMYSPGAPPPDVEPLKESVNLYIPNSTVGAVIGTGGSSIKGIISSSGATIKIEHTNKDEVDPQGERKVTITGHPNALWKAQQMIFKKVSMEARAPPGTQLKAEIFVPSNQVGRIIGKGGQTVREIQRETCAIIKLIQDSDNPDSDEVAVHIIGEFFSIQAALFEVRRLLKKSQVTNLNRPPHAGNLFPKRQVQVN